MYERYFNLSAEPFRLTPEPRVRFRYHHPQYARAKAYMAYAFRRAEGFVLLTGPPGTGKTSLIRDVVEYLADERVEVANLVSTQLAADDLLRMVAYIFGVDDVQTSKKSHILQLLTAHLLTMHKAGKRALLIVDEAQDLASQAMEELRLLTNLEESGKPLIQIFLVGQPEIRDQMRNPLMEPVYQRVIAATHLKPLTENETKKYVEHRLRSAGWRSDPAISKPVYGVIYRFSEGVPRRINLICNRLLLNCFVEQSHRITIESARSVVTRLQEEYLATGNMLFDNVSSAEESIEKAIPGESPSPGQVNKQEEVQVTEEEEEILEEEVQVKQDEGIPAKPDLQGHFFLIGQPKFQKPQPDQKQAGDFQHRTASSQKCLTMQETRNYVEAELKAVGWQKDPAIGAPVFRIIHEFSEGVPTRINMICNRLLLKCYVEQRHRITVADARTIANDLSDQGRPTRKEQTQKQPDSLPDHTPPDDQAGERPGADKSMVQEEAPPPEDTTVTEYGKDPGADKSTVQEKNPPPEDTAVTEPGKASFESLDVPLATYSKDKKELKKYVGPEQRRKNRREGEDRRQDIRFEIGKEDRRKKDGKRRDDKTPTFW